MHSTRRTFVKNGTLVATGAALAKLTPQQLIASPLEDAAWRHNAEWKALIQHGLDVAQAAGASYSDIRVTFTRERAIGSNVVDSEEIHCGVRCLVGGYWGFASSPVVHKDEMTRLAREATIQAKVNTIGKPRIVELAKAPAISSGTWTMPVQIDPFDVHPLDGCDLMRSLNVYGTSILGAGVRGAIFVTRQDKAFGSTDGSYCSQRTYLSRVGGMLSLTGHNRDWSRLVGGVGWELFNQADLWKYAESMVEEMREDAKLERKLVDVGRYPMVLDAESMSGVLASTVGLATELDRALGYEANATGTSYLNMPNEMVGVHKIGSPLLSVNGNRNAPGGIASVKWDDDGVSPEPFELVRDGVLQRFQTTRESAQWIRPSSPGVNAEMKSSGCAYAANGVEAPLARSANLTMVPADNSATIADLYHDVKRGVMFKGMQSDMDFQQCDGLGVTGGVARCYEITNGKVSALLVNAGVLFRAPELWKSLMALGGKDTVQRYGCSSQKGQPAQRAMNSVSAVPALFENGTIIDFTRKA